MRVQLVHTTRRRSGESRRRRVSLEVEELRIGRGADNDLELDDLAIEEHHSILARRGAELVIQCLGAAELELGGTRLSRAALRPGDAVRIGAYELRLLDLREDEDLCLEVNDLRDPSGRADELRSRTQVGVERGLLRRRTLSWLLVVVVAVLFGVGPVASALLRSSWNSGPLSRAHLLLGDRCEECHARPFVAVRDRECLVCHASIGAHFAPADPLLSLGETRCASCHREHNGAFGLAALEQPLCAACHTDLSRHAASVAVRDASDFGRDHPTFQLALEEESALRFDHAAHLDRELRPDEPPLACASCHLPDLAGGRMRAIEFERHCQGCHSLSFDDALPETEAPHLEPSRMREALLRIYAERELRAREPAASPALRRRIPGAEVEARRAAARQASREQVARASAFLMDPERPGPCAQCHELVPRGAPDGGDDVVHVALPEAWLPRARFRHDAHAPFGCETCHASASGSERASDVLIPGLEECRTCHGGGGAGAGRIPSDCVLCHPFHRVEHGPLRPAREVARP